MIDNQYYYMKRIIYFTQIIIRMLLINNKGNKIRNGLYTYLKAILYCLWNTENTEMLLQLQTYQ